MITKSIKVYGPAMQLAKYVGAPFIIPLLMKPKVGSLQVPTLDTFDKPTSRET